MANRKGDPNEQRLAILAELLKDPANKECADCGSPGPRWASWSLGVFLCIQCAGVHRSLGTHITKVKSATLDKWTDEQVAMMKSMGNAQAKKIYEANVPNNFIVPREGASGHVLENWIRAKYEKKLFMGKPSKEEKEEKAVSSGKQRRSDRPLRASEERREREQQREQERTKNNNVPCLIDIDAPRSEPAQSFVPPNNSPLVPPVSAPVSNIPAPAQSRSALLEELFTPSTDTKSTTITRSMDKNSIMSLYNHPQNVTAMSVQVAPVSTAQRTFVPNYNVHLVAAPYPGSVVMTQPGYPPAYPVYTQPVNYSPYIATTRPYN